MKSTLKDILRIAALFLILLFIYASLDILDIPSRLGLTIQHVNWDAASLLCSNLVVITLFVISYRVLDKRSIQKEHNKRHVALYMIKAVFSSCAGQIEMLNNKSLIESIASKTDFGKPTDENYSLHKLLTVPFEDHEAIVSFASSGVISSTEYEAYHMLRVSYYAFITSLIAYPQSEEIKAVAQEKFLSTLRMGIDIFDD